VGDLRDQTFGLWLGQSQAAAVDFGDLARLKTRFAPSEPTLISGC